VKEGANPELDGLKKLVSQRWRTQAVEPHPDPDVLSAFAENALPESERAQVLQHLGACNDCRDTLYLAAEHSPQAQTVLSFQPKPRSWLMFRWGALAASVLIVAGAVIARYPRLHEASKLQAPASAAMEKKSKLADKEVPSGVRENRDRLEAVFQTGAPSPPPPAKDRPATKHMTAKPQANMEFDDSDQVRVATAPTAQKEKKADENLQVMGRNVGALSAAASAGSASQAWQSAGQQADARNDFGYAARAMKKMPGSANGMIGGTVLDPSGAAVGNATVTTVGPVGSKTAISDQQGNYVFTELLPGAYSLKAEAPGFKSSEITNVAVLDNKAATVRVRLQPGSATETVQVNAETASVKGAASAPAPEVLNALAATESEVVLQKAVAGNSPQRAKSAVPQWTISAKGTLERSLDLGKTWHKVSVAHGVIFRALSVLGSQIWVGGNRGSLYHSSDSGLTWTKIVPSTADATLTVDISHVEFSDGNTGTVSTTNGETWSTSDSGTTWRRQ